MKKFICGLLVGTIVSSLIGVFAVNSIYDNPYPIYVNGEQKQIQGYNIDGYSYFKLRDVAEAVGGFDVSFVNDTVQINLKQNDSDSKTNIPSSSDYEIYTVYEKTPVYAPGAYPTKVEEGWISDTELYKFNVNFNDMVNGHYGNPKFSKAEKQSVWGNSDVIYTLTEYPADFEMELNKEYTFNGIRMKKTRIDPYAYSFVKEDLIAKGIIK